jgi:hypothetical protein
MRIPVTTPQAISSHLSPGVIDHLHNWFPAAAGVLSRAVEVPDSTLPPPNAGLASCRKCKTSAEPTNQKHDAEDGERTHPVPIEDSQKSRSTTGRNSDELQVNFESWLRPVKLRSIAQIWCRLSAVFMFAIPDGVHAAPLGQRTKKGRQKPPLIESGETSYAACL